MRERGRALVLVALLLVSAVGGVASVASAAESPPSGMVSIPDEQISEDVPSGESIPVSASAFEDGRVLSSAHASSMSLTLTTAANADEVMGTDAVSLSGDEMVLVLSDDTNHEGRRVAIEATALRQALGYLPRVVQGVHDDGTRWSRTIRYDDGFVVFSVPEFSSNVVSFGGETTVSGRFLDGSTASYDLADADSVSNLSVNVTGAVGHEQDSESGTITGDGSSSLSIAGSLEPQGPSGATDPSLTITGERRAINHTEDLHQTASRSLSDPPSTVVTVKYRIEKSDAGSYSVALENASGHNTTVASGSTDYAVTLTDTKTLNVQTGGSLTLYSDIQSGYLDYIKIVGSTPRDVSANIGGSTVSFGDFAEGETKTRSIDVPAGASSLDLSTLDNQSSLSWSLSYEERVQTHAPSVTVNGNTTSTSQTLSPGETASLSTDTSWIQSGTNTIEVGVGDGTLSSDAPTQAVNLSFRHDSASRQSVNYTSSAWSERYNVSTHFASAKSGATFTVPFASHVVEIGAVEKRIGGGSWMPVSDSATAFHNGTLTVDIGDVPADTTARVRANGVKVGVDGGEIQVTDPTTESEGALDSKLKVTSVNQSRDLVLNVGGTLSGDRVHYAYEASWSDSSEYALQSSSSGQHLVLPNAVENGTVRVSTIPVKASPQTGDVAVTVETPRQSEPVFTVSSGNTPSDSVDFTFLNAKDETKYILWSQTYEMVRDSGTANSPLTLTDDDSRETLEFRFEDGTSSSDSDDSGSTVRVIGQYARSTASSMGGVNWLGLGVLLIGGIGVLYVGGRFAGSSSGSSSRTGRVLRSVAGGAQLVARNPKVVGALLALGLVGALVTGVIQLPPGTGVLLLVTAIPLGTFFVLRRTGSFSLPVFGVVSGAAILLGLQLTGNLVSTILSAGPVQKMLPFLGIGVIYVAYRAVKAYRRGKTTNVVVDAVRRRRGGQ
ncbi:hypothetical protein [Halarchaeum sp. P4]|uniref:hypothetical protein n=1 Tax=Halarchaeum sp. P4 TaxID=3421639 RepID=UPI003EBAC362